MHLTINNKSIEAENGMTILEAARTNGIDIPTLCNHEDLSPSGACRMCIVEVEGMRTHPTACTTPIKMGMVVNTDSPQIQAERKRILQLILSKHPVGCLLCDQSEYCQDCMETIRKVGVTTGCRTCPKDQMCELQNLVKQLLVQEVSFPIRYRNIVVEKNDPFYDRDYNLCILCGRCVQACQEFRLAETLAFIKRGHNMFIGPAFEHTHLAANCEFCGACVSICPTGALSEKVRKWDGKPDTEVVTTCPYCGIGCQISLQVKNNEVIGSLGSEDSVIPHKQLCVKGRFGISEVVNHYARLKKPVLLQDGWKKEITWDEANSIIDEKLSRCLPQDFQLFISPNCTNEDLYIAQKFSRIALRSNNIDTPITDFFGNGFYDYLNLLKINTPLSSIKNADGIICIGLDPRFNRSVLGVEIKKAAKKGAHIVTIHPNDHHLSLIADTWFQTIPGKEAEFLKEFTEAIKNQLSQHKIAFEQYTYNSDYDLEETINNLRNANSPIILIGPDFLQSDIKTEILKIINTLAKTINAGVIILPPYNNLYGSIFLGAHKEFFPGSYLINDEKIIRRIENTWHTKIPDYSVKKNNLIKNRLKVLYVVGENTPEKFDAEFVIYQNFFPPENLDNINLILPSAVFSEVDGSYINYEGRHQKVNKAVTPPGEALSNWQIICQIARKMNITGFEFNNIEEINNEIANLLDGDGDYKHSRNLLLPSYGEISDEISKTELKKKQDYEQYPFTLMMSTNENMFHGFSISTWVDGMKDILFEDTLIINPADAEKLGISTGDEVIVKTSEIEFTFPARLNSCQQPGTMNITLQPDKIIQPNPLQVSIRKK